MRATKEAGMVWSVPGPLGHLASGNGLVIDTNRQTQRQRQRETEGGEGERHTQRDTEKGRETRIETERKRELVAGFERSANHTGSSLRTRGGGGKEGERE